MIALQPLADMIEAVEAKWWPVQIEPIAGSGERLTIGVAVASPRGCIVKLAPELERLGCLYDRQARILIDAAHVAGVDLRAQIGGAAATTPEWRPTFSLEGLTLGLPRVAAGASIDEIADLALAESSSLASRAAIFELDEEGASPLIGERAPSGRRLRRIVQGLVVARRPQLKAAFNAPIAKTNRRQAPKLDFSSGRLAASFDDVSPRSLVDALQAARISIYTLDMHRELDLAARAARHVAYLMISPRDLAQDDSRRLVDARGEIRRVAEARAIAVEERSTPIEIANDIVSIEAAA